MRRIVKGERNEMKRQGRDGEDVGRKEEKIDRTEDWEGRKKRKKGTKEEEIDWERMRIGRGKKGQIGRMKRRGIRRGDEEQIGKEKMGMMEGNIGKRRIWGGRQEGREDRSEEGRVQYII